MGVRSTGRGRQARTKRLPAVIFAAEDCAEGRSTDASVKKRVSLSSVASVDRVSRVGLVNAWMPCESVSRLSSVFEAEGELLDDGVGEDFAGDAFDLGLDGALFEAIFEGQEEILSLPHVGDAAVFH